MSFKFRKSIKIIPGVKLNLGKSSVGISIGGKGFRTSINSKGRQTTTMGIPGTGLSYQKTTSISSSSKSKAKQKRSAQQKHQSPAFEEQYSQNASCYDETYRALLTRHYKMLEDIDAMYSVLYNLKIISGDKMDTLIKKCFDDVNLLKELLIYWAKYNEEVPSYRKDSIYLVY